MSKPAKFEPTWDKSRSKWVISIPEKFSCTGKRKREFFDSKTDAKERSRTLKKEAKSQIGVISEADHSLLVEALNYDMVFREFYGIKGGLKEACENYTALLEKENRSIRFGELLAAYKKQKWPDWSADSQERWVMYENRFEPLLQELVISLDTDFWRQWFEKFAEEGDWENVTYNDSVNYLSGIWKFGLNQELVDKNPIDGIIRRKVKRKPKAVYEVEEVEKLLNCAWEFDRELVPFFAITIFAGLRPQSEAERLTWKDVDFAQLFIRVAEDFQNKTGTKRFVPIAPNLLKWLTPWKEARGSIIPSNFVRRRRYILRGKYQSPEKTPEKDWTDLVRNGSQYADISRHSYASYLDAQTGGEMNTVIYNLGHTTSKTYHQHYKNARTPDQADLFWNIEPPES